ncbi:MAG: sulfite exporter TauE/SafE family protein [Candidatus Lokiarchaeota archaeon]|nr:sulfite exporter TauE/SafE family protein [Candidatus Lokiarchaeota archaeon]
MDLGLIILLLIFGIIFGVISSLAGIGGGALYMSLMILLLAIPIDEARNTSTFIIFLFSCVTFISYYRQGKVDLKLTLIFASFALMGSITATVVFLIYPVNNSALKVIIASIVLISGINMIRKALVSYNSDKINLGVTKIEFSFKNYDYKSNLKKGILLFFFVGFIAYLSGIGGGLLFVPILCIAFRIPIHYSTAISSSMIFFIGIYNTSARMLFSEIHYVIGILIGIGAITGSLMGAKLSNKIPKNYLQFGVAAVLILLAIRMYFV